MRRVPYLLVAILLATASAARAQQDWPVPRGPANEPLPFTLDAKYLADVPRDFFEDAPACILFTRTTHLIESDGTVATIVHEITRFNGRKGIEKLGEYRSIYFNPRYEKLTLNEARVLKADGSKVPVEPRHVQLRDTATDYQVYDDSKQLVISWPNLQVGDAYEVKWTVRGKNPEFAGEFFARYNFGDDEYPVVRDEMLVRVPVDRPIRYAGVNGPIEPVKTERDNQATYHWRVTNKEPLPRDDDRPSKEELRWQVAFSTFPSWEAIGRWKQNVRKECWECSDALKAVVATVAGPEKTPLEKARALTYWVRQNIRYLSRGPEGMGYTPHPPAQVLANRFGDCKDQAQLLAVMLREIGLPAWLVTLGTLDDGQVLDDVPSPWGTHAIVFLELDGKEHWIDTTASQAPWDYLPRGDCGRRVYLTRDGCVKLGRTPALSYASYRVEQTTHVTVAPDGTSHNKRTASYHGTSAWSKRDAWLDTPLGERRRLVTAELQDAHAQTRLVGFKVDERSLRSFDDPVRAEMEFEIPEHFGGDSREGSLSDSVAWSRLLAYTLDQERDVPFELPAPFESVHRFVVQLPPALRAVRLPEDKKVRSAWGFLTLKVVPDPNDAHRFEIMSHTRLTRTRVECDDFAAFQRFHDQVSKAYRFWLSLQPTQDIADAEALEALVAKAPATERYSTRVLARLYLDNDRHADASRVLAVAVKHQPDNPILWEMRLQAATEPAEKATLYRAMIQQFPKEGQYVAALGANLAQRGEYAEAKKVLQPLTENATPAVRGAAHYQLARIGDRQGDARDALKHMEKAIAADGTLLTEIKALDFKARLHGKLGQLKDAIAAYQLALEVDDKSFDLLAPLVRLEWQAGLKRDALDHLRRYTVAVLHDRVGLATAADLHLLLGRTDDALELAGRIAPEDQSVEAQRILGLAHLRRKEYAKAIVHLERAGKADDVFLGLVDARLAIGDVVAAYQTVSELRGVAATSDAIGASAFRRTGNLMTRMTKLSNAVLEIANPNVDSEPMRETLSKALSRMVCAEYGLEEGWSREHVQRLVDESLKITETSPALALRGWLALERGMHDKALTDADRAIAMRPADARAYLVRGRVRLERGERTALADLEQAAKLSERADAIVLHWLAAAQAQTGRLDEALRTQQQAVRLQPDNTELVGQMRALEAKRKTAEQ
jgi:tetratricopeptide (TPR) repeat protein